MGSLKERLKGGLFISSMMGCTTGAFVAERGRGAGMVQIGALVADATDRSHDARYLLPIEEDDMVPVLAREVEVARAGLGETPIALNAAPGDLTSARRMARAFRRAGGDLFELNCHGGYGPLLERGLLRAMALPENRPVLLAWLGELCRLEVPVVVKFHARTEGVDFAEVLDELAGISDLFGIHFNVRLPHRAEPDTAFVRRMRPAVPGMLWCSGHVTTRAHVDALFEAGADCVGIAQGVLDDPGLITRLAAEG